MFYFRNWDRFCQHLADSGIRICTAADSLQMPDDERFIVLKHDVEANVPHAYRLAEIEHKHGICGSYYVQAYLLNDEEDIRLLQEMRDWGHEISYHYDVLDANGGNYELALKDFRRNLQVFQANGFLTILPSLSGEGASMKLLTICQHGNPVKKRVGYTSNRDFFRKPEIRNQFPQFVDMVVDYSQHTEHEYKYISDVSYRWNIITLPETNDLHPEVKNEKTGGFDRLTHLIDSSGCSFVVSTHPHRWKESGIGIYTKILLFRMVRTMVMAIKDIPGVDTLLNRFYYLAKKI